MGKMKMQSGIAYLRKTCWRIVLMIKIIMAMIDEGHIRTLPTSHADTIISYVSFQKSLVFNHTEAEKMAKISQTTFPNAFS